MKRYCAERVTNLYKSIDRNLRASSEAEDMVLQHAAKVKEVDSDDDDFKGEDNMNTSKSVL